MLKTIIIAIIAIIGISLATAGGTSEFTQYLGHNVTVNACNQTIYQGTMVAEWPTSIVVQEKCTPEIGNVTIKKSCVVWIHNGYDCL